MTRSRLILLALLIAACLPVRAQAQDAFEGEFARGASYLALSRYDLALDSFKPLVESYHRSKETSPRGGTPREGYACLLSGRILEFQGEYDRAWSLYGDALSISSSLNNASLVADAWFAIGELDSLRGEYDDGLKFLERAAADYTAMKYDLGTAKAKMETAVLSAAIGDRQNALALSGEARSLLDAFLAKGKVSADERDSVASCYRSYAEACRSLGKTAEAAAAYQAALRFTREGAREGTDLYGTARSLLGLGILAFEAGDAGKAGSYLAEAEAIAGNCGLAAVFGSIKFAQGEIEEARAVDLKAAVIDYKKALEISARQVDNFGSARTFYRLGSLYLKMREYDKAITNLKQATTIVEGVLRTIKGMARVDYVSMQIAVYQCLVMAYMDGGNPERALYSAELAKAKYLAERIGDKAGGKRNDSYMEYLLDASAKRVDAAIKGSDPKTLILYFSSLSEGGLALCTIADGKIAWSRPRANDEAIALVGSEGARKALASAKLRGLAVVGAAAKAPASARSEGLAAIVESYRTLLSKPTPSASDRLLADALGRAIFDSLFDEGAQAAMRGRESILVIPDGALSFLPFEALRLPDKSYLAEKYSVSYLPSFAVGELASRRAAEGGGKSILAFGGAAYGASALGSAGEGAEKDRPAAKPRDLSLDPRSLNKAAAFQASRGAGAGSLYDSMGIRWPDLPGTLEEVRGIKALFPDGDLVSGIQASEERVKAMNASGELSKYKAIHFATHGIVFPEMPELSAIVLSQAASSAEDGYLQMNEIASLNLKADFVCLSACETGLGKLYGGEGVMGITQAFFIAGASGICSTLWQVDDAATKEFMIGVYRLVAEKGSSYRDAILQMKRSFIRGPYSAPCYWAPFLFYGGR